ncbi:hypothetical protein F7725_017182 [Dissostichus mawsoni]|uniref:Cyclic AMP-dependent transcription factor ATF-7 n=1 Tax=Dissostichus mawsoni TaxID=36200 RepID=A0A7J5Z5V5_DISMA|nr:hypothetical protein F7725_017182 [Dissostichus mawsoni]
MFQLSRCFANGSVRVSTSSSILSGAGRRESRGYLNVEHLSEMGDDRPFVCTAPGCGQRFTNEDHLSVHKHKHEMTLKFGPARTDTVIIADQTPTPTRFLKNCEEAAPLQTPSEVKVEDDVPLQVDSSSPGSPDSSSSMSDNSRDSSMRGGKLARPLNSVPYIPGIPGPPVGGASSGSSSPSGYSLHSEAKMRLKAALTHQGPGAQDGAGGGAGSNPAVPQRQEQSQQPSQNSDAPSPAQPQVSPAQPTGGRRRRASEMDPDERRERFLERNRAAASRCRQKRKVWVNSLEKKADDLVNMNVSLSNEVGLLRNEVAQLKQLLLAHKDCPVTVMQKKAAFLGGEETSRDTSSEPIGSPAAVIQHGPPPTASASSPVATINGLSVRAAEAVAMSVLAGMGSGQPGGVVMATQSQSAQR